jgi:hypothetical protein
MVKQGNYNDNRNIMHIFLTSMFTKVLKSFGSDGIRTHAPEETGALNQRLRPLGHATLLSTVFSTVFRF